MTPPAKKTTPTKSTSSLSDLLNKDNNEEKTPYASHEDHVHMEENTNKSDSGSSNSDDNSSNDEEKKSNAPDEYPSSEEVNKQHEQNTVQGLTNEDSVIKDDPDTNKVSGLSNSVVHDTSTNKTPAELSSESPEESAKRFGIKTEVTKEDIANPRVQVYSDTVLKQVPSGTHLHPDIAKSTQNYGIAERTTDSAQVKRTITETYDFADSSPDNDKF